MMLERSLMLQTPLQMTQKEKSGLRILKEAVRSVALLFVRLLVFRLFCQLTRTLNIPFIRPFVPLFSRHRFLILHSLSCFIFSWILVTLSERWIWTLASKKSFRPFRDNVLNTPTESKWYNIKPKKFPSPSPPPWYLGDRGWCMGE